MAASPDGPVANEVLVCEVTGVSQQLRQRWVRKHGLRRRSRGTYEESDARELAALKAILETLGPSDGAIAWALVQHELPERWQARPLILVFDTQDKEASLATSASEIAEALQYGQPAIAVRLDDPVARAARAFLRAVGPNDCEDGAARGTRRAGRPGSP